MFTLQSYELIEVRRAELLREAAQARLRRQLPGPPGVPLAARAGDALIRLGCWVKTTAATSATPGRAGDVCRAAG